MSNLTDRIDVKQLGERIAYFRKIVGLSNEQLSKEIGVTHVALSAFESGKSFPLAENLIKICNVLDVSPDILLQTNNNTSLMLAFEEYSRLVDSNSVIDDMTGISDHFTQKGS